MNPDRIAEANTCRRGLLVDENIAMNATGRLRLADDRRVEPAACIAEIERRLGRRLSTPQRSQALWRSRAGENAAAIADWLYRQEAARLALNDPLERRWDTPARRDGDQEPGR